MCKASPELLLMERSIVREAFYSFPDSLSVRFRKTLILFAALLILQFMVKKCDAG